MSIGVCYPDKYAVEETIKLFKNPGENNPVGSMIGNHAK